MDEIIFFEKLKKALCTQKVYENFKLCLALFNQDKVNRSELIELVEPFLGKFPRLYMFFKGLVDNCRKDSMILDDGNKKLSFEGTGTSSSASRRADGDINQNYLPTGDNNSLRIDYLSCKQYGASYRDISSHPQPINTGQTELCKEVNKETKHQTFLK